jgi:hypothetical protein
MHYKWDGQKLSLAVETWAKLILLRASTWHLAFASGTYNARSPSKLVAQTKVIYHQLKHKLSISKILTVTAEKKTLHRSNRLNRVAWPSASNGMIEAASTTGSKGCM